MKKILIFAAAAALLVACEKPCENCNQFVEVGGVAYRTVTLANGQTWMAENLRVVPEGMTVSDNPAEGNIWYPYSINGKVCTPIKDEAAIKELGYLYDYYTALKLDKKEVEKLVAAKDEAALMTYLKKFEGTQGICPDGWHLPTLQEFIALNGERIGVKDERYPKDERDEVFDEKAPFYDAETKAGKIENANKAGFNITFPGSINKTSFTAKGMYIAAAVSDACTTTDWVGKPSMNGFIGSSVYLPHPKFTNIQFWGLQTNFAKSFAQGGMQVNYTNIAAGYSVRCVKNN